MTTSYAPSATQAAESGVGGLMYGWNKSSKLAWPRCCTLFTGCCRCHVISIGCQGEIGPLLELAGYLSHPTHRRASSLTVTHRHPPPSPPPPPPLPPRPPSHVFPLGFFQRFTWSLPFLITPTPTPSRPMVTLAECSFESRGRGRGVRIYIYIYI